MTIKSQPQRNLIWHEPRVLGAGAPILLLAVWLSMRPVRKGPHDRTNGGVGLLVG